MVDLRETPAMVQAGGPLFNSHRDEVKMTDVNEALLQRIVALRTTGEQLVPFTYTALSY